MDPNIFKRMQKELSEKEFEIEKKKMEILDLYMHINFPLMFSKFLDTESDKLLDEKIEVLTA